jgi:hypothetical protein
MPDKSKKTRKERITLEESARNLQKTIDKMKYYEPPDDRGVKEGTKRGKYKPRKTGQIKDKKFIKSKCKQCGREFKYKRIGKRMREYCSDKCKQKYYRKNRKLKEIERKIDQLRDE